MGPVERPVRRHLLATISKSLFGVASPVMHVKHMAPTSAEPMAQIDFPHAQVSPDFFLSSALPSLEVMSSTCTPGFDFKWSFTYSAIEIGTNS